MENTSPSLTTTDRLVTRITSWVAILILIFLGYKAIMLTLDVLNYEETNDAQIQEYITPVVSRVNGYIKEIRYEENQRVSKGDTLIIIEDDQYKSKQSESIEAVNSALAQIDVLEKTTETAEKLAAVAKFQISAAEAKFKRAKQDYVRYTRLVTEESATAQQMETKKEQLDVSGSEYTAAMGSYQAALARINDYRAQKAGILAEIKRKRELQRQAELDLSYTVIKAPHQGTISRKTIQTGQFIQANQTLASIVNAGSGKWVIANFKETQLSHMRYGQDVLVVTDAYPDQTLHGKIESFSPGTGSSFTLLPPDNATGNFVKVVQRIPVKIIFSDPKENNSLLRSGMNATVKVIR